MKTTINIPGPRILNPLERLIIEEVENMGVPSKYFGNDKCQVVEHPSLMGPFLEEVYVVATETVDDIIAGELYKLVEILDGGGSAIIINNLGEKSIQLHTEIYLGNVLK